MTIYEKLQKIQFELKAPKNLYNSFGKYKYRNAESICEAFKPFGEKYGVALTLEDRIVEIGGRVYVEATARLIDTDQEAKEKVIFTTALAREASEKKGMDDAQVTGATSSYARKYALNGLFLLDDTKDPDSEEYQQERKPAKKAEKAESAPEIQTDGSKAKVTPAHVNTVINLLAQAGIHQKTILMMNKLDSLDDMTMDQYNYLVKSLQNRIKEKMK